MPNSTPIAADWYDYPQYYDIAFSDETQPEADFIEAACTKYGRRNTDRLLEPACGTGRLVTELSARGYQMTGLDLSGPSLAYLRRRLKRRRLAAELVQEDMADFSLPGAFDAAYSTFDGFRHLLNERDAVRHLECVAESLRPGGIYILGFHLLPPDASEDCTERWTEQRSGTKVTVTLRVLETDRRRRLETLRVSLLVRSRGKERRLRHDFQFRMYTAAQFKRTLAKVPTLELCDVFDFWYEIDQPLKLNNDIADTVFILRKKS